MLTFRKSLLAVAAFASLVTAGLVAPAAAQGWDRGGGWGHHDRWDRDGWGHRGPDWGHRRHHRPRCWVEERPVRVHTPWGPRMRYEPMRVCR
ncbi:MAG: hypothetical protein ABTQ29_08785 [Siculibacillus sp.]